MDKVQKISLVTDSALATEAAGEVLGANLRGGEVIELASDLGGGKTTFVRGLARGATSADQVASPTFTVSKVYQTEKFEIHHFDFYRLAEAGIMSQEVGELVGDPAVVLVVEWSDVVQSVLPTERLAVRIERSHQGEAVRRLDFVVPPSLAYLLTGLETRPAEAGVAE